MKHVGRVLSLEYVANDASPQLLVGLVDGGPLNTPARYTIAHPDLLKVVHRTLATGDVLECTLKNLLDGTVELIAFRMIKEVSAKPGEARHLRVHQHKLQRGEPEADSPEPGEIGTLEGRVLEEGEDVFSLVWDADRPGGSGVVSILRWHDAYYYKAEEGTFGPFANLHDALEWSELDTLSSVTVSITCSEMNSEALVSLLTLRDGEEPGFRVEINGEEWTFGEDGNLLRAT